MKFEKKEGNFSRIIERTYWEKHRLVRGKTYMVAKEFVDAEGILHRAGEKWVFKASIFSPYDDIMLICISSVPEGEWGIQLSTATYRDNQREVLDNFLQYVVPVD